MAKYMNSVNTTITVSHKNEHLCLFESLCQSSVNLFTFLKVIWQQGPCLMEGHVPPSIGRGTHNIFCPPQYFVIKNKIVVQISRFDYCYCWKPPA